MKLFFFFLNYQMTWAHGFLLKAQKVLLVGTAPGKANLCHTAVKTGHYKCELKMTQVS